MSTAVIIAIVVVGAIILFFAVRGAYARSVEMRRNKAGELREEATVADERAREAEIEAQRREREADAKREEARQRAERADKLDPDVDTDEGDGSRSLRERLRLGRD